MQYRIKYKILLYTFKALNNLAPVYLQELVNANQPTRALRSEDLQLLKTPRILTKTYGERRLDKSAATLWNIFLKTFDICNQLAFSRNF